MANYSIFVPRRKESEGRSFWDTDRVVKKALDVDYGRMLKEERVLRLISKADAEVVRGEKTVKESLEEVTYEKAAARLTRRSFFMFSSNWDKLSMLARDCSVINFEGPCRREVGVLNSTARSRRKACGGLCR